jgi:hypothetical protein
MGGGMLRPEVDFHFLVLEHRMLLVQGKTHHGGTEITEEKHGGWHGEIQVGSRRFVILRIVLQAHLRVLRVSVVNHH